MILDKVLRILCDAVEADPESVEASAALVEDLGMDSLDLYNAIMKIEEEFDICIDSDTLEEFNDSIRTVNDVAGLVASMTEAPSGRDKKKRGLPNG